MVCNVKSINNQVLDLAKHISILVGLNNKQIEFKFWKLKHIFRTRNDSNWKKIINYKPVDLVDLYNTTTKKLTVAGIRH